MRHHSVRGIGIRYVLALTLPISGIVLVLYTVVQLVLAQHRGIQPAPKRYARAALAGAPGALPAPSDLGANASPAPAPASAAAPASTRE